MAKLDRKEHSHMLLTIRKINADMSFIKAHYDAEWEEYQIWVLGRKDATLYQSDDAGDLYGTAREMQRTEEDLRSTR